MQSRNHKGFMGVYRHKGARYTARLARFTRLQNMFYRYKHLPRIIFILKFNEICVASEAVFALIRQASVAL